MKRLLLLALCALFALNAEARTVYVDAKRPNNNGNGLSPAKAKKTLQAAINIAKKGDTILVAPGTYAPIKTNNKKIAIKSIKGQKKTKIVKSAKAGETVALAQLGKTWSYVDTQWDIYPTTTGLIGEYWATDGGFEGVKKVTRSSYPLSTGRKSTLTGFLLDGLGREGSTVVGVSGGTVSACTIQRLGKSVLRSSTITTGYGDSYGTYTYTYTTHTDVQAAYGSKLADCVIKNNMGPLYSNGPTIDGAGALLARCTASRCKITGNKTPENTTSGCRPGVLAYACTFDNSLLAKNSAVFYRGDADSESMLGSSTFLNCTIADNTMTHDVAGAKFAAGSKFYNCILRNNRSQREWLEWDDSWNEIERREPATIHNADPGNVYKNTDKTNKNPKFTSAYKLKKDSYCINKGKLTKKQKKQVGRTDLAGKARIKGKAIDRGCYEF